MTDQRFPARARLLARLALLASAAALAVPLALIGSGGLLVPLLGALCLVLSAAGAWGVVAHRGVVRAAGLVLLFGAPIAVLVMFTLSGLWSTALAALALWAIALACARAAVRAAFRPARTRTVRGSPPRHPALIMNPRSGGGKVARFGLVEKAERLGARVVLLDAATPVDVSALAERLVAEGADLLGVAGGDGTQALVAEVAARHDLPFLVISAGTRNHFAMDLGLDRADPARCLDALTDGEELRVDLGTVSGRPFVNTVSFGAYARVVQRPEYRDAKAATALDLLPDLLVGHLEERLDATADGVRLARQQALLVSNNPYSAGAPLAAGRRSRLDRGVLGVVGVRVENAAQAAELAFRGAQASGVRTLAAERVVVGPESGSVPVGVDGEALVLPGAVVCTVRPGALRVLVPVHRPGAATAPALTWRKVAALAFGGDRDPGPAE